MSAAGKARSIGLLPVMICLLLLSCRPGEEAGGASTEENAFLVSLLPTTGANATGEETGAVADSIRDRMSGLGFTGIEVFRRPGDSLLVRYATSPARDAAASQVLVEQVFSKRGVFSLRLLHPESERLSSDLRLLAEAGPEWGIIQDEEGNRIVVGEARLLGSAEITSAEVVPVRGGEAFDVVVRFGTKSLERLKRLRSRVRREPLVLVYEGRIIAAPLSASRLPGDGTLLMARGLQESDARELAFLLESPLVVPLQIRGAGGM